MLTVLDIGAGKECNYFARRLRRRNPDLKMLILCGEPSWGKFIYLPSIRVASTKKVEHLIEKNSTGTYRIEARYEDFGLPENSLDLVTLNCPHPLAGPGKGMIGELERCLKPGDLFFSSHVLIDAGKYPESFKLIASGPWRGGSTPQLM